MQAKEIVVKPVLHNEFRAMTNAIAAFATATLLMFLQGNFGELDKYSAMALFLFTAAIPLCVAASFISFLFSQRSHIPAWANTILDLIMGAGWVGGIVGLGALLVSASGLLAAIFAISVCVAFFSFVFIAYGIGRSDAQSSVEELPESDESGAELKPGNDLES
ncbi:hypothetical protein SAMN04487868_110106 [Marinobacter salarius]|jgi:hypothetical protein|uniref:Uncharacterized protein n=2 Tax=Marinobacter TaxID=2742 RepID=W5YWR9_9GAMM|nr:MULTISPECIES: hypothetical protein [Marinobacter]AHI33329.1 hypothetical protein AU15_17525 [Marinobacter salarius]KXJ45949.1 MAG: hypothetical protein AXW11_12055 [Marinobacter sp. Hex_13]SFL79676.1 hypothetical protein SAMN04487868_110106 [Marinobacter salarius]|tara:strand:- start:3809 stop:4297 length:489 start_codon:yes stop_codon:yes gene_type:complete